MKKTKTVAKVDEALRQFEFGLEQARGRINNAFPNEPTARLSALREFFELIEGNVKAERAEILRRIEAAADLELPEIVAGLTGKLERLAVSVERRFDEIDKRIGKLAAHSGANL